LKNNSTLKFQKEFWRNFELKCQVEEQSEQSKKTKKKLTRNMELKKKTKCAWHWHIDSKKSDFSKKDWESQTNKQTKLKNQTDK
jgi:hypothetical protein